MSKVLIRGPLLTNSGYGIHSRQVFRWLLNQTNVDIKCEVLPWGITPWIINDKAENGLIAEIMGRTNLEQNEKFDVAFQIQLPNEWETSRARKNVGISALIETDMANPDWANFCNRMDHIVAPSQHSLNSILNHSKINTKYSVIPESYPDCMYEGTKTPLNIEIKDRFNFLIFGQITGHNPENDRKNLFYSIKWFCEEFANDENVGLIVKTNAGRNSHMDRQHTLNILSKLIREVRPGAFPKIQLLHGNLTSEEINFVYSHKNVNALLALTRGEGFGLTLLEAATAGLPIVATGWSSYTEFLDRDLVTYVDYNLTPVHQTRVDNSIFVEGTKWAQPVEEDAKRKMRLIYENNKKQKANAKKLAKILRESHSFASIERHYDMELGYLLK
jgi:glycosyltransferase involved in cell wall biosynthesis